MADLTWYSREKADRTFATKEELAQLKRDSEGRAVDLSAYATKAEVTAADSALSLRVGAVESTAGTALQAGEAATKYATKEELRATEQSLSQRVDSAAGKYATKEELGRYATSESVASTYAEKGALTGLLTATDAASTYATKAQLAQAQIGGGQAAPDLSGLATKAEVQQGDRALEEKVEGVKSTAQAALPKAEAASTYATKEALESLRSGIPSAPDVSQFVTGTQADGKYATKTELSGVRAAIPAAQDLSPYLRTADADTKYATKADIAKAQAGGQVDLSGYLTAADAANTYSTKVQIAAMGDSIRAARAVADAALPKAEAASTYATKAELAPYLKKADADTAYATKADLAKAQAGGQVDLSGYVTHEQVQQDYVSNENLGRRLEAYASKEELAKVQKTAEDAAATIVPPFRSGERYSSPVTYYWPDYYNETKGTSKWAKALKAAGTLGIVILNKDSGNWDEKNEDFGKQAARALAAGARRAVFYVKTQYGIASLPSSDAARNGVPNPDKYTKEYILGQISKFTEQYGDVAQGVFLDEAINGWGAQAGRVQWYKDLIAAIREQYGRNFYIVVNAGSNMSPEMCALDFDTAMMFEQSADEFLKDNPASPILPDHMKAYPSEKWWAVIHGVTQNNYQRVFEKLDTLPIGHAYITDGVLVEDPNRGGQWEPVGNPYENPPSEQLIKLTSSWIRGTLGLSLEVEAMKKAVANMGAGKGGFLVLGPNDPVPAGTPDDTVIVRREA